MHEDIHYGGAKRQQSGVQGHSPGKLKTCRAEPGRKLVGPYSICQIT